MGQSRAERETALSKLKYEVCEEYDVYSDEVILRADHKVVIDRRRRYPTATPVVVGEWS